MKVQGKVVVVTGGGSGMGRELTLQLLKKGARVAIADVNTDGMEGTRRLAGDLASGLSIHHLDISNRELVEEFPKAVIEAHGQVDGIINNAGVIQPFIPVNELDYDRIHRIININFYGTLYMVKAFLPLLLERPEAHIANVSSMGGFIPFPGQTFYGASKSAVKLLTEGLYAELKDTNVNVTVIFPGAVNTNISANSGLEVPEKADRDTQAAKALSADKAAEIMIRGIEKNKYRILVGKDARFMDFLYRLNPERATRFIVKQMSKLNL